MYNQLVSVLLSRVLISKFDTAEPGASYFTDLLSVIFRFVEFVHSSVNVVRGSLLSPGTEPTSGIGVEFNFSTIFRDNNIAVRLCSSAKRVEIKVT